MRRDEIRHAVKSILHAQRVRIKDGDIYAYGRKLNAQEAGWHFIGHVYDLEVKGIGMLDGMDGFIDCGIVRVRGNDHESE